MIIRHRYLEIRIIVAVMSDDRYRVTVFARQPLSPEGGYRVVRRGVGYDTDRARAIDNALAAYDTARRSGASVVEVVA